MILTEKERRIVKPAIVTAMNTNAAVYCIRKTTVCGGEKKKLLYPLIAVPYKSVNVQFLARDNAADLHSTGTVPYESRRQSGKNTQILSKT
jgi:hypothetical protein